MRLHLSIGQRIALGFSLLIILVLIASATGLVYSTTVEDTVNTARDGVQEVEEVANLQISWLAVVATIDNILLTRDTGLIDRQLTSDLATFNEQLAALQTQQLGDSADTVEANEGILAGLQTLGTDLNDTVTNLVELMLNDQTASAEGLRHGRLASLQRRLNESLDQLSANIQANVDSSVDDSVNTQNATRTYWFVTVLLALGVGTVAAYLTVRSITRPVAALVTTAQAIESGDLSQRVTIASQDEIGRLGQTFNSMTEQLNGFITHLEDRVNARTRDLQAAVDVSRQITTVLNIDELLQQVATLTAKTYNLYSSFVFLPDANGQALVWAAGANREGNVQELQGLTGIPILARPSAIALAARSRETVRINDTAESTDYMPWPTLPATRSELAIPMLLGNRLLGIFDLQSDEVDHFSDDDLAVLSSLAEQIAIAVRNAQLFAETEQARAAAEEANRVKSQFMANMSHELRTPLNAIINFSGFMLDGILGPVNEQQSDSLNKVITSSQHLLSLINDILDLTKIEVGMMDLFIQEVDLNEMLDSIQSTAKGLLKDKPVKLRSEVEPHLPIINGDRRRIRQVLLNVMSNAVKFTEKGSITVRARRDNRDIHIAIEDTGIGIGPDQEDLVFETFRQAKHDLPENPGTGLGMPISKAFVEAHGGRIWFESVAKKGTTFHIVLPVSTQPITKPIKTEAVP